MRFTEAAEIASTWVRVVTHGDAVIWREKTVALPYGWVFFYNSSEYIADPTNVSATLVGNSPILIDRVDGELRVLGAPYEAALKALEANMPGARLQMRPEVPEW